MTAHDTRKLGETLNAEMVDDFGAEWDVVFSENPPCRREVGRKA